MIGICRLQELNAIDIFCQRLKKDSGFMFFLHYFLLKLSYSCIVVSFGVFICNPVGLLRPIQVLFVVLKLLFYIKLKANVFINMFTLEYVQGGW